MGRGAGHDHEPDGDHQDGSAEVERHHESSAIEPIGDHAPDDPGSVYVASGDQRRGDPPSRIRLFDEVDDQGDGIEEVAGTRHRHCSEKSSPAPMAPSRPKCARLHFMPDRVRRLFDVHPAALPDSRL